MVTVETLKSINVELDEDVELKNDVATSLKLTEQEIEQEVNLPGQIEVNALGEIEAKHPRQIGVRLPRQIEMIVPRPPSRNLVPINDRQDSNSDSNQSDVKDEQSEQMKMLEFIFKLFAFYGLFLGYQLNHHSKPYKHFMFYNTTFFLSLTAYSMVYTIYLHCYNGDTVRLLEPLAISGLLISTMMKWYSANKNRHKITALLIYIKKFCRANIYGRQAEIIISSIRRTKTYMLLVLVGGSLSGLLYAFAPIYVYVTTKEVIPLVPIEIVFCDMTQTKGFIVATIVHLILGSYAVLSVIFYSSALIFAMANYTFQVTLIGDDFLTLDEMWNGKNDITLAYKRSYLKNICKKRQDMNNYIDELKSIFETKLFWYFCTNYFAQIICLYDIKQNGWIGGYAAAFATFMEMMFYCYMGTEVSIVDDTLCYVIYHSNWYMYDLVSQRMICLLLNEAQKTKELQLGPIGSLNLMTGVMIVKSIFTYYRIMSELF